VPIVSHDRIYDRDGPKAPFEPDVPAEPAMFHSPAKDSECVLRQVPEDEELCHRRRDGSSVAGEHLRLG
jgi:hypothetical protein